MLSGKRTTVISESRGWGYVVGPLLTCAFLLAATQVGWARPPTPWPGPRGPYVFLEAEAFGSLGAGWSVVPSQKGIFADVSSGLDALAGWGSGDGGATTAVSLPEAGTYTLWLRYVRWPAADASEAGPFQLRIVQGGTTVFDHDYNGLFDPGETPSAHDANRFGQFDWVSETVTLASGPAQITLSKLGAAPNVRSRQIDCLLLTMDGSYQPDYRDFAPQTYLRIRLHSADPGSVYIYAFLDHMRAPWYRHVSFGTAGWNPGIRVPGVHEDEYLTAGRATPWMNISRLLYSDSDTIFRYDATVNYHHPDATSSDYSLDFATAPTDTAVVKTLRRRNGPGSGIKVRVPPDLTDHKFPLADYEYAQQTQDVVRGLTPVSFGRRPTRFPILTDLSADALHDAPGVLSHELTGLAYLGLDGLSRTIDPLLVRAGLLFGWRQDIVWPKQKKAALNDPDLAAMRTEIARYGAAATADPLHNQLIQVNLMDEASANTLTAMVGSPVDEPAFIDWLRRAGRTPADLGVSSWSEVHLTADRDTPHPALYLFSQEFRAWSIAHFFAQATALVHTYYPRGLGATQNYSDGAVYFGNMYAQGNDYYTWFRNHALDIALSEDWTNIGSTDQLCGWNVALLRSATKFHHEPIHMYDISSSGRGPLRVKLKAYADIAQGAKALDMYSYTPLYAGHESGWYRRWSNWPAVAELTREVGAAEDVLIGAMPNPAQTAIIYSIPYDIWNVGHDNVQGNERMHTYLALRHDQIPVDVVSDRDVRDGLLRPYKVAYLFGEQLDHRDITPLVRWVRQGGTLVLSPGAASRDELNQVNDELDNRLQLVRHPEEILQQVYNSSRLIVTRLLRSQGEVHLLGSRGHVVDTVPLLARRQRFGAMHRADVLAKFDDGTPAAVVVHAGNGRVVMFGFMPALAYIQAARMQYEGADAARTVSLPHNIVQALAASGEPTTMIWSAYGGFPYHFDANLRRFITQPVRIANVQPPVKVSVPQVEATLMEGSQGWVIPLANWTGSSLSSIKVSVKVGRAFGTIHSAHHDLLAVHADPSGWVTVTLPLDSTDFLFADWS
jgi:hypothetical protein